MKIAIDVRALHANTYGGVAEYIRNLLPAMFEAAPEHEFILFANSKSPRTYLGDFLKYPNVRAAEFNYPNKLFTFSCRFLNMPKLDKFVGGADVFFNPHILPAPVSSSCPKVTTFHDISFEYFPEFFDIRRRVWHKYITPKRQAASSDKIIAVSGSTKSDLENLYAIPKDKTKVVYSGINHNIFSNPPAGGQNWNEIKNKYGIADKYILSLSVVEPRKNISCLLRAFHIVSQDKNLKNIQLVIAGEYGWSYKKIVLEAQKYMQRGNILFTGPLSEEEKAALYKNSLLFVYPSLYEGFGFPPLEAMTAGVPVIVSHLTSLPEVVGDAGILVNPYKPNDIADAIKDILSDKRLHDHFVARGKERAGQFSWPKTARKTLEVLEGCAKI